MQFHDNWTSLYEQQQSSIWSWLFIIIMCVFRHAENIFHVNIQSRHENALTDLIDINFVNTT